MNFKVGDVVPNAVQVALPTAGPSVGQIDITYDAYGATGPTTDILIDVVGYTTGDLLDHLVRAMPFAESARNAFRAISVTHTIDVVQVEVIAPLDRHVAVNTTTNVSTDVAGEGVRCSISGVLPFGVDPDYQQAWESSGPNGDRAQLAGTRVFPVLGAGGGTFVPYRFSLRCEGTGPSSTTAVLNDSVITAIYTPAP